MKRVLAILVVMVWCSVSPSSFAQKRAKSLRLGLYAPSLELKDSATRLEFVRDIAAHLEKELGVPVEGLSFADYRRLEKARVDFAIVDALCTIGRAGRILAVATIKGATTTKWTLFARGSSSVDSLKGKRLAMLKTGCGDKAFIENVLLERVVSLRHFGGIVQKPSIAGALAEVTRLKGADAVFAPARSRKGTRRVFSTTAVPNSALVQMNRRLSGKVVQRVKAALAEHTTGSVSGWRADRKPFVAFTAKIKSKQRTSVFAPVPSVRLDPSEILAKPGKLDDSVTVLVGHHFLRPPERL